MSKKITVEVVVNAPLKKAWEAFTAPKAITHWNFASDDWKCPRAQNELREGGGFNYRMESVDGKFGFDFEGTFHKVILQQFLEYTIGERRVTVEFFSQGAQTRVVEEFEPEGEHSLELQQQGWQSILNNYKIYVERV